MPKFECKYPCSECDSANGNVSFCTSCVSEKASDPRYLMPEKGTCAIKCDEGFTSNGNKDKFCEPCDASCDGCYDNGMPNDRAQCIHCSTNYPFRKSRTNFCLKKCNRGLYEKE